MLKYENIQRGTKVRAWDHRPASDRADCYLEGEVVAHDTTHPEGHFLIVLITTEGDSERAQAGHSREGLCARVPMETTFEWEDHERVEILKLPALRPASIF